MSRKTFRLGGSYRPPDPLLFREGRGGTEEGKGKRIRGKGTGRGEDGRGRGRERREGRENLCSCKFSLKYALE